MRSFEFDILILLLMLFSDSIQHCYESNSGNQVNWIKANKTCNDQYMHLATIFNEDENNWALKSADLNFGYWIGGQCTSSDSSFANCTKSIVNQNISWVDGTIGFTYQNWKEGGPNGEGSYLQMYGRSHDQNGKWSDADFANTKYFVCQCDLPNMDNFTVENQLQRACQSNASLALESEIAKRPCLKKFFPGLSNLRIEASNMGCTMTVRISGNVLFKPQCLAPAKFSEIWTYEYPIGTLKIEPQMVNVTSVFDATDPDLVGISEYLEDHTCESWKIPPAQITVNDEFNDSGIITRTYSITVCQQTANATQTVFITNKCNEECPEFQFDNGTQACYRWLWERLPLIQAIYACSKLGAVLPQPQPNLEQFLGPEFVESHTSTRMLWSGKYNISNPGLALRNYRISAPNDSAANLSDTCFAIDRLNASYTEQNCSSSYSIFCKRNDETINYLHSMDRFVDWVPEIVVKDICSFNNLKEINAYINSGNSKCCGQLYNPTVVHYDQEISSTDMCEKKVIRIWEIQDECGNRIQSQPQAMTYSINAELFILSYKNETVVDCTELNNLPEPIQFNETCDTRFVRINYTILTSNSSQIIRTWNAKICPGSPHEDVLSGTQIVHIDNSKCGTANSASYSVSPPSSSSSSAEKASSSAYLMSSSAHYSSNPATTTTISLFVKEVMKTQGISMGAFVGSVVALAVLLLLTLGMTICCWMRGNKVMQSESANSSAEPMKAETLYAVPQKKHRSPANHEQSHFTATNLMYDQTKNLA